MKEELFPIYQCKCGKKFCLMNTRDYAWKIHSKYYCSYTCWNKDKDNVRDYIQPRERRRKEKC